MNTFFCSSRMLLFFIRLILGGVTWLSHHDVLIAVVCTTVINLCYFLLQKGMLIIIFCVTHSLTSRPSSMTVSDSRRPLRYLSSPSCWYISFSWMYSQPVHSSMSCIHCLLGLPWCRSPSMIPSRTVSANRPALFSAHKHNVAAKFMDFAHNAYWS